MTVSFYAMLSSCQPTGKQISLEDLNLRVIKNNKNKKNYIDEIYKVIDMQI